MSSPAGRGILDRLASLFEDNLTGEREMYILAREKLVAAAKEAELAERAEANTTIMLRSLLSSLGFTDVTILFNGAAARPPSEVTSVVRFVECAGNGRSFFREAHGKQSQGTQWKLGAVGVAEWTGVPLGDVLERAGLKRTARDVMPEGLDELRVRRPIPRSKALEDDTLLVFAMNGEPLPPDHGFPVRMLVPAWVGVANVKWIGKIQVSEEALYSDWNTNNYVLIGEGYRPEGPAKGPALTTQNGAVVGHPVRVG